MALGSVNVPGGAATDTVPGLMTPEDKSKLAGIGYGTCDTAAATAEKVVSVDGFSLVAGAVVFIKFTYYNATDEPTLNVNGTGAKAIVALGQTVSRAKSWGDGATVEFAYDGTSWVIVAVSEGSSIATGLFAHAEGYKNVASGEGSHAEGGCNYDGVDYVNDVSGIGSHVEGIGNKVTSDWSAHAEGYDNTVSGNYAHAENRNNEASGACSHAEGYGNTVSGGNSHAEGYGNTVSGGNSHAEGYGNTASNNESHAEGCNNVASGACSHAEGESNTASNNESHAEGYNNVASGACSHAEGESNTASNNESHAEGYNNVADNICEHAGGKYNKPSSYTIDVLSSNVGDAMCIGNGTSDSNHSNCFRVTYAGEVFALSAFNSSGADYSEYIAAWADGNPDSEDRVGYFVTVTPEGLAKAQPGGYIAGITSGNPSVIGNSDEDYYSRYERDSFGRIQWQDVEVTEDDKTVIAHQMVQAADYDATQPYTHRADRAEWDCVGMVGVLPVRDDGTCQAGGFAKCGEDGVATATDGWALGTYYVVERVDDNVVKVIMR